MTRMLNPSNAYPEQDWIVELSPAPHVSNGKTSVQNGQDVTKTPGLLSLYGNKQTEIEIINGLDGHKGQDFCGMEYFI
jgi:hypothetical protein